MKFLNGKFLTNVLSPLVCQSDLFSPSDESGGEIFSPRSKIFLTHKSFVPSSNSVFATSTSFLPITSVAILIYSILLCIGFCCSSPASTSCFESLLILLFPWLPQKRICLVDQCFHVGVDHFWNHGVCVCVYRQLDMRRAVCSLRLV